MTEPCIHCDSPGYARGLCASHYSLLSKLIRRGEYSWLLAENQGKALPKAPKERHGRRVIPLTYP